jgi:hypothetical protein
MKIAAVKIQEITFVGIPFGTSEAKLKDLEHSSGVSGLLILLLKGESTDVS